jgi:hypothetical protein
MFIDFIATVSAGFALAGVALILRSLTRRWLPAWIVPAAAGLGMLTFAVWNEYTWYPRTAGALPEGVVVARAREETAPWRPWTYMRPIVTRFSAVDTRLNRTNPEAPGQVLTSVLLMGRWQPSLSVPVVFDCPGGRRAALTGDAPLEGELDWEQLPATDETLLVACKAGPAQG